MAGKLAGKEAEIANRYRSGESVSSLSTAFDVSRQAICYHLKNAHLRNNPGRIGRNTCPISHQRLMQLYMQEGLSITEIGLILERSASTVWGWLRQFNIPRRSCNVTLRLMIKRGAFQPPEPTPAQQRHAIAGLRVWEKAHPLAAAAARSLAGHAGGRARYRGKRARWVICSWCALRIRRYTSDIMGVTRFFCSYSHRASFANWTRWHPHEPRPLVLTLLREGSNPSEIGAAELEITAWQAEQEESKYLLDLGATLRRFNQAAQENHP